MDKKTIPTLRNMEHDLLEGINSDAETKAQKKKYDTGVAVGISLIFLSSAAFVYLMIAMPSNLSPVYLVACAASVILMIAAIVIVTVLVRRLQNQYFAQAGHAAENYAQQLTRKIKDNKKQAD